MRRLALFVVSLLSLCAFAQTELPSGGEPLLSPDAIAGKWVFNQGSLNGKPTASGELVEVDGPGFDQAMRVKVEQPSAPFYNGAVQLRAQEPVKKGDMLLARLYFRSIENAEETGQGFATLFVQGPAPTYKKYMVREIQAGKEWREILLAFPVTDDLAAGELGYLVGVGGGTKQQTWEVGGMQLFNYGQDVELADLPMTRATYAGREPDAAWRAEAEARIEKHRKGDFTIKVVDANGKPVPGAEVEVEMLRHAYHFGSAVVARRLVGEGADDERYREVVLEYFNEASPENDLKWPPWAGDWSNHYNQEQTLAALAWLQEHGFYLRGHVMVWPSPRHLPKALQAMMPKDPSQADPILKERTLEHIADIATKTRGYLGEWDVVNEPYGNHYLMDAFGDEVMVDWFNEARKHLPTEGLFLNDYSILSSQGRDIKHQQDYEETIRFLQDSGAPITGMGMQGHFGETPTDIERVYEILEHFHGEFPELDIRVTEFDINTRDEALQADYTRDFLTIVFSHPATVGVQLWGFWAGQHWRPEAAMFTRDWRAKPNAEAWLKLVKNTWWTDVSGKTNAEGEFAGRGFYGDYAVKITHGGRTTSGEFSLEPDGTAEFVFRLSR